MSFFNKYLGKKINSGAMKATSTDSLSDAVATSAVAVGLLVSYIASVNIDGWIGLMVSLFILYSGIMTAKDSLSPLLGQAPALDFVKDVENTVLAHDEVVGIHDLIVHDYGPGRRIISLHAEVPSNSDILVIHDAIDIIELELRHKFSCDVTIHMDPIAVDDESTKNLCTLVKEKLKQIDENLSIHDFRMVEGKTHTNLIFDVTVPYKFRLSDAEVGALVRKAVHH